MAVTSHIELWRMLERERARLEVRLRREEPKTKGLIGDGNPIAGNATAVFERIRELALCVCLADMLVNVEEALCKFSAGSYGVCECCGKRIGWARLEAKPEAKLCIKCQQGNASRY